jgi:hypothetical protein
MEQGTWYRLAIHEDKRRIRLAPDGPDFASLTADNPPALNSRVTEDQFDGEVTAELIFDSDDQKVSDNGWITVVTVGPDGTCKEDGALIVVREGNFTPIEIRVRGVTGTARFVNRNGGKP